MLNNEIHYFHSGDDIKYDHIESFIIHELFITQ